MTTIAAVVTLYGERGTRNLAGILDALRAQTRPADTVYLMCEDVVSADPSVVIELASGVRGLRYHQLHTPRDGNGRYSVIPYAHKINVALRHAREDYIVYVTDDSLPHPEKFHLMAAALDADPTVGVVYCKQRRNGGVSGDQGMVPDAFCRIDHTQVMHRRTDDRWTLDVQHMRLGDAWFWRSLHASLGPFHYVPSDDPLDVVEQTVEGISASW